MTTIVCVMKTGGEYNRTHVQNLKDMVGNHPFVCLSDDPSVPGYQPLNDNLPGWWSKIEAFAIPGPVLFLDLDTIVLGNLDEILETAKQHEFLILRDVYRGQQDPKAMQSSVMGWASDVSYMYDEFIKMAAHWMMSVRDDQRYIEMVAKQAKYWQDILPDALVSFKVSVQGKSIPEDAKIIFFHGQPRPWQQSEVKYGSR